MPFPTEISLVERAEVALGVRFPDAYRSYLLRSNGGEVSTEADEWTLFPVLDETDRRRLARSASHIVRENEVSREWRGFPGDGVAFAAKGSGDRLVFMRKSDSQAELAPTVHLWSHETGKCVELAASLEELVSSDV